VSGVAGRARQSYAVMEKVHKKLVKPWMRPRFKEENAYVKARVSIVRE